MNNHFSNSTFSVRRTSLFTATLSALVLTCQLGCMPAFAGDTTITTTAQTVAATADVSESTSVSITTSYDIATDMITITATGFAFSSVDKVFFDGTDITSTLSQLSDSGIVKTENNPLFFNVNITGLNFNLSGEHELKFILTNGTVISRTAETFALPTDKASCYRYRVSVNLYDNSWWSWSKKRTTVENTVTLYLPGNGKVLDYYGSNFYAGEVCDPSNIGSLANKIEISVKGCSISKKLSQKDFTQYQNGKVYGAQVDFYKGDMNCN